MTAAIIITICVLLLLAYVFDLTSHRTKIPSVILLLFLGWGARQLSSVFGSGIPDLTPLLPILGTIGLILIVLEGSLELELNRSKIPLIKKAVLIALLPIFTLTFLCAFFFSLSGEYSFRICLLNAIPLCVISSAIAISSAKHLPDSTREFVTYESSLSDIFGVLLFNFVALNETLSIASVGHFSLQLILIIIVSFIATIALSYLLNRIDHHIKFAPIILLVILIYEISKAYHLPSLVFILLFGLFIGNLDELKRIKWIEKLKPEELNEEVRKFKDLIIEATFLVRAVFFLLFGYLIETSELLDLATLAWSVGLVTVIFLVRFIILKLSRIPLKPALFIAPRGLITILLFFAIDPSLHIFSVNRSLIIQVIILSALVMMAGMISFKENKKEDQAAENLN